MARLYTFGCSYSQYVWPMWPDIVGQNFDHTENYGRSGCGNLYIFYRLMYCLSIRQFTKDDCVIVQWSGPNRYDHLTQHGEWNNIGDRSAELFVYNNLDNYNSDQLVTLKQLSYMLAAARALDAAGVDWYFMFLNDHAMVHQEDYTEKYKIDFNYRAIADEVRVQQETIRTQYAHRLVDSIGLYEYMMETFGPQPWRMWYRDSTSEFTDSHPIPLQTLSFLENVAAQKIPFANREKMSKFADYATNLMLTNTLGPHEDKQAYDPVVFRNMFKQFAAQTSQLGFSTIDSQYIYGKQ